MAAQTKPNRVPRQHPEGVGVWLVDDRSRRRPTRQLLQVLVLPPLLALALIAFGVTFGQTFGRAAFKAIRSYTNIPVPREPLLPQTTYLYDRDGRLLTTLHAEINRTEVPLKEIAPSLQQAVIAIEDRDFYNHGGVDVKSLIRAAIADVQSGKIVQGGSTITQQYVKLVFTGSERTLSRKLKEAVIATKLGHMYTKAQILEKYLNLVYFGHGAYGAEAAAETFFGVHASDLTVVESALLAGLIQAPSSYDPSDHPDAAKARRNLVLQKMAEQSYISQATAGQLAAKPVKIRKSTKAPVPAAYFVNYVSSYLQDHFGTNQTFAGGLQVQTTLDWDMQRAAERAVASHLPAPTDPSGALVAIDPRTGEILAMVGGRNFTRAKFNLATQAHRQTGSAFKPFTYATAMTQRYNPNAVMSGPSQLTITDSRCFDPTTNKPWQVNNFADESAGTMSIQTALAHSVNTIFAQLVVDVGPANVAQVARRLGIASPLQPVCSITLGSQSVTPLDMTTAYATIADRGIRHWSTPVASVSTADGRPIYSGVDPGKRVLGANDADLTTQAMQGVIEFGTGTAANIGRPAAGKTGTNQDFRDAWFCGFVPQLAACVWVGYPKTENRSMQNVEGFPDVFGGSIPAEIWHDFMVSAVKSMRVVGFHTPSLTGYTVQPARSAPIPVPTPTPTPPPPGHCKPRPHCH